MSFLCVSLASQARDLWAIDCSAAILASSGISDLRSSLVFSVSAIVHQRNLLAQTCHIATLACTNQFIIDWSIGLDY